VAVSEEPTKDIQVFDVVEALASREQVGGGRVDMATSPNSYIAAFGVEPRHGETRVHSHPDSDQILFILKGECTVEGLSGRYTLGAEEGVLIPAGVNYGFTNLTEENLVFLSMRTESSGGRRVAYVPSVPSDAGVSMPAEAFGSADSVTRLYAYALDNRTLGISPEIDDEWNRACVIRMECTFERAGNRLVAVIPERLAFFYRTPDLTDGDYKVTAEPEKRRIRVDLSPLVDRQATAAK